MSQVSKIKISNMADAAAVRREARRKRILENSHNRLQLISGKITNDTPRESPARSIYSASNDTALLIPSPATSCESINNGLLPTPEPAFLPALVRQELADDGEVANDLSAFMTRTPEPPPKQSLWTLFFIYKYDIVFLSLFIQFLYSLSVLTVGDTYFFIPLIIYTATKFIWLPIESNSSNPSSFTNIFLLLNGIPVNKVNRILSVLQMVVEISQNVSVFLFTTICVQSLFFYCKS